MPELSALSLISFRLLLLTKLLEAFDKARVLIVFNLHKKISRKRRLGEQANSEDLQKLLSSIMLKYFESLNKYEYAYIQAKFLIFFILSILLENYQRIHQLWQIGKVQ